MADITVTAASVIASANAVLERGYNAGATITQGQVVYKDTADNKWKLFDSDAGSGAGANINDVRGIALTSGANNQPMTVCLEDIHFTPGGTITNGTAVYGSKNAGAITHDVPASANYPVFLGLPKSATIMNLKPVAGGVAV